MANDCLIKLSTEAPVFGLGYGDDLGITNNVGANAFSRVKITRVGVDGHGQPVKRSDGGVSLTLFKLTNVRLIGAKIMGRRLLRHALGLSNSFEIQTY